MQLGMCLVTHGAVKYPEVRIFEIRDRKDIPWGVRNLRAGRKVGRLLVLALTKDAAAAVVGVTWPPSPGTPYLERGCRQF